MSNQALTTMQPQQLANRGEMATAAMAAKAKATVEARYVIALQPQNRRQFDVVRQSILSACRRAEFAEAARYKKPVGGGTIEGFSIRFAEEAIKAMKNISVESSTIYEDDSVRTVQINVTDLENNITYGKEVTVSKTVERRQLKNGQVPISQRQNSTGQITYLVEATEDEIANKIASAESKIIRNCGLRLVPSDILEEAEALISDTLVSGGSDPKAAVKKLADAFSMLNVSASELSRYLGHSLETTSPKEFADLRSIYNTIKDGSAAWSDFVEESAPKPTKPSIAKKAPETTITVEQPAKIEPVKESVEASEQGGSAETSQASPNKLKLISIGAELDFAKFKEWIQKLIPAEEQADVQAYEIWDDVSEAHVELVMSTPKRIANMKVLCAMD